MAKNVYFNCKVWKTSKVHQASLQVLWIAFLANQRAILIDLFDIYISPNHNNNYIKALCIRGQIIHKNSAIHQSSMGLRTRMGIKLSFTEINLQQHEAQGGWCWLRVKEKWTSIYSHFSFTLLNKHLCEKRHLVGFSCFMAIKYFNCVLSSLEEPMAADWSVKV